MVNCFGYRIIVSLVSGGGEDDDGEPDKMAIAAQRISRFTGWFKGSIVRLMKGMVNFVIRLVRCQLGRRNPDVALEMQEDRDFAV